MEQYCSFLDAYNADNLSDTDSECSFSAPPFSPINRLDHVDETEDDIVETVTDISGSSTEVNEQIGQSSRDVQIQITQSQEVVQSQELQSRITDSSMITQLQEVVTSQAALPSSRSPWTGFKLVGDNIDKNFHPSFQCSDNRTLSIHYFHVYAVRDRINFSSLPDIPRTEPIDINKLLVSLPDIALLNNNSIVLIGNLYVM